MAASAPPATMTSAEPSRIMRMPSPIEWAPAAHAVVTQRFGPVKPNCMPTRPAVAFGIIIGTSIGLTRCGPFSRQMRYLFLLGAEAADTRADDHAAASRVDGTLAQAGVAQGVDRRGETELRHAVGSTRLLDVEVSARVEVARLRRRRSPDGRWCRTR